MILSICDNPDVLSMIRVIKIFIDIIKVIVPIMLIISLMIDYVKGVTSNEELISKNLKLTVLKMIATALIFFVPTFVNLIVSLTIADDTYKVCLNNANSEKISESYEILASNYLDQARKNLSSTSLASAKNAINKIPDKDKRENYLKEYEKLEKIIYAKELIEKVRNSKMEEDYNAAVEAVKQIEDETVRKQLEEELKEIEVLLYENIKEYSSKGYVFNPLGIPYYNQCDSRWGNHVYDQTSSNTSTMCSSSCGYTSLAMVASGLNHDFSLNPLEILKYIRGGDYVSGNGRGAISYRSLIDEEKLKGLNLKAEELWDISKQGSMYDWKKEKVMDAINAGKPIVFLMEGHFLVLVPDLKGKIIVLDPFWTNRNGTYTVDELYDEVGKFRWAVAYTKIN